MHRICTCQLAGEMTAQKKGLRLHVVLPRDKGFSPLASEEHFPKSKAKAVPREPLTLRVQRWGGGGQGDASVGSRHLGPG